MTHQNSHGYRVNFVRSCINYGRWFAPDSSRRRSIGSRGSFSLGSIPRAVDRLWTYNSSAITLSGSRAPLTICSPEIHVAFPRNFCLGPTIIPTNCLFSTLRTVRKRVPQHMHDDDTEKRRHVQKPLVCITGTCHATLCKTTQNQALIYIHPSLWLVCVC